MQKDERRVLESQLTAQLADVERSLSRLQSQRDTLRQLLIKVRQENTSLRDVTRKNSIDRVLVESRILEVLTASSEALSARRLYWRALEINPTLRSATFRSYLHRLKSKGLIVSPARGSWIASAKVKSSATSVPLPHSSL